MKLEGALELIEKDLASPWREASVRLTEYVFNNYNKISHLPYTRIAQIIGSTDPKTLLVVTQYCSGSRLNLLKMKFELVDGNEIIQLDDDDIYFAQTHGYLIHPDTGNAVDDYEKLVVPYFIPGNAVSGN